MSRGTRSLALQLILTAVSVQSFFILSALILFPLVAPFTSYGAISDYTARRLIAASLHHDVTGWHLVATPTLTDYARSRPSLVYAVGTPAGTLVPGSTPELAVMLKDIARLPLSRHDPIELHRAGRRDDVVHVGSVKRDGSDFLVATAGNAFGWQDLPSFLTIFLPAILPAYGPVLLGILIGIPVVVRRTLQPVRGAAAAAALIDVDALDQRLPNARVPAEFQPLVSEINAALDRLSDGWTRQRLFTANAAHELRTPVAVLQARVETLPIDPPLRAVLTRDVRRLAMLIDQLLAIARLERRDAVLRPVELVALIRDLVADWAPVAIRAGLAISFHHDRPAIWVNGDARAIEGAVAALIDNALKVEPEGRGVEVSVAAGAEISVRDHGPGVAAEERSLVFEPFWRKDERSPGSGLGLATVRETARLHGGRVRIDETVHDGAAFVLHLPEIARPDARQSG